MEDSFEDKVYREYILETIDDVQLNKLFTEFERAIEKWEEVHSNENFLTLLNTANAFFRAHIAMSGKMDACAVHIFCIYRRVLTGIDSMETFFTLKDEAKERGFENHALFCNFMPGTDMVAEKRSVLTSDDLLSWVLANKKINALWERMEGCLIDWRDRYGVFTHEEYFDLIMSFKDDLKNDGSKIDECLDCLFAFNDASKANLKELLRVFGLDEMTAHLTHTLFEYRQSFSGVTEEECAKID